jgi:CopG family nickel-responsive transcriptional regulator
MKKRNTNGRAAVCRFGVSMPADIAAQLDALVKQRGFANRSQALADLVRNEIVQQFAEDAAHEIAGTITLIYDHHKRNLQNRLTDIQHDHEVLIVSVLHVHLDHHNCMEVLAVRGRAGSMRRLADRLIAVKGVKHGKLTVTTTGKEFSK